MTHSHTHTLIIGGGFAGLSVARKLRFSKNKITLLDKKNHHLFQPLLYQVASAALSPADIAVSLREVFQRQKNLSVIMGEAAAIEKEKNCVVLSDGFKITYEKLVVAVGARHSYFGNDQWARLAPGLKTIKDALCIREHLLLSFEKAERSKDKKAIQSLLRFVVIGGGPTGVEMAGAIAEIAYKTMFKNFRYINPRQTQIYLIEGSDRILPPFPPSLSARAKKDLEKLGVKVLTKTFVTNITEEGVQINDTFLEAKNVIWAAGNQASSLLKTLNVPLDRQGRAIVLPDLTIPDYPEIFVIGDASCTKNAKGNFLPAIAPTAIQQGNYVGRVLKKSIPKHKRKPFYYFDKGCLATIGKGKAVGYVRKFQLTGWFAWAFWGGIHVAYLIGYRNRFTVMLNWVFHYLTGVRGARLIHKSINDGP